VCKKTLERQRLHSHAERGNDDKHKLLVPKLLVPKLQLGNQEAEAPASRDGKLELY